VPVAVTPIPGSSRQARVAAWRIEMFRNSIGLTLQPSACGGQRTPLRVSRRHTSTL
jgi:hypothetical protein